MPSSTLSELAESYEQSAEALRKRLRFLRQQVKEAEAQGKATWHLKRRMNELAPMLTYCNKTAKLLRGYYNGEYVHTPYRMYPDNIKKATAYSPNSRQAESGEICNEASDREAVQRGIFIFPREDDAGNSGT